MDDLKLALIVNAVSPVVGGVLLRGEKGTAKSTVVRALAALLPDVAVIEGCRFSCAPSAPDAECPDGPHRIGGSATTRSARLVKLPVWAGEDAALADRIAAARTRLPAVVLGDPALRQVTSVCAAFDVDGLRADLVTARNPSTSKAAQTLV